MTNNTDALPPALAEAITDNTPPAVRERFARLAELARTRQVVLLTCHEEVLAALKAVEPQATVLEL